MSEPHSDDLPSRILDMLDGTLDANELAGLDADLRASEEARELFRQLAALHSILEEQGSAKSELGARRLIPIELILTRQRQQMVRLSVFAAAAVLLISAVALWSRMIPTPVASFQVTQDTVFTLTHPEQGRAPKGMVFKVGSRLQMSHGTMEAMFASGVRCVIDAPCDVSVIAEDRISITSGTAWFEVPPAAVGFTVEAGPLEVIDLGTTFGVMARANARREVHVTKGSVEVRSIPAGESKDKLVLAAGEARQLDERGEFLEIALQAGRFTTALPETTPHTTPAEVIVAYHTNGTSRETVQSNAASITGEGITAGNAVFARGTHEAWRVDGFAIDTGYALWPGLSGRNDVWHAWREMGEGDPIHTANYEAFTIQYMGPMLTFKNFKFDLLVRGSAPAWNAKYTVFASVNGGRFQTLGKGSQAAATTPVWVDPFGSPVKVDISSLGTLNSGDSVEFRLALSGSIGSNQAIFTQGIQVSATP